MSRQCLELLLTSNYLYDALELDSSLSNAFLTLLRRWKVIYLLRGYRLGPLAGFILIRLSSKVGRLFSASGLTLVFKLLSLLFTEIAL